MPAYVGVATESFIIDTDHWRHAFLLLGLLWGLIAATRSLRARRRGAAGATERPTFADGSPALARP